jgi:hypothetical protein
MLGKLSLGCKKRKKPSERQVKTIVYELRTVDPAQKVEPLLHRAQLLLHLPVKPPVGNE